ncbi:EmrB/QacA family drug resistance transporter [Geotalea uraniireducens]|uniref:EmrB/QacA family drug resistance transporter n=1 Tax=Geotalea uraniireducens TaxID=351604 RepID=A0ABM8ELX3_9BACT|nr:DHA2 family efflux MFS transporter permease subunit [Geotalea uraniireducens]BDV43585.1 EmrB/QacA family drug resistance transporter [Geotalea uraniireducens]
MNSVGEEWRPSVNPWIIAAAVMLATFMEVLDTTIVSVALPHIAGSLSATTDEATWTLTSYLVSNAIILPASGWLAKYLGRKRFLIGCIVLFTTSSLLCGLATSMGILILARVIQGVGGGALQPISQAILLESFPPEQRGMAMAAFALGVVVAPILGPTLGGWLTDNYSWRWAFYINVPVGILAAMMIRAFIEDPPYIRAARPGRIDGIGFGLMAVALATLQIILDRGQQDDWFAADWIRWFAVISLVSLIVFIVRELLVAEPIVNLRVLQDRNFAMGIVLITMVGVALYSAITLLPIFLQTLMGYSALQSGMVVGPRGLGALLTMPVVGFLTGKVDFRKLIGVGFIIVAFSLWWFGAINLEIAMRNLIWPSILTGVGLAMIFVPLSAVAMGTLPQMEIGNASGIFNLMRNVGGSVGISAVTTMLTRDAQTHQANMVAHLTPGDLAFGLRSQALQRYLAGHADQADAARQAQGVIYGELQRQSTLWAFVDNFRMLALICLVCAGTVFFFKRVKGKRAGPAH